MLTWNQPNNKHTWAFIYFCKRQGDRVRVVITCDCYQRRIKFCGHNVRINLERNGQ